MSPRPSRPLAMRAARTLLYRSRIARTRLRRAISAIGAAVNDHPIFILGMQKAGTSAVAHLLGERTASTTTVDFFDEVYDPVYPRLVRGEISTREYVLRNRLDFSRDIIKEPNLTLLYRQLLEHFPAARFVFVVRDPRDNIRSLLNHVLLPGDASDLAPARLQHLSLAWRLVIDGRWLGFDGQNHVDLLAARWAHFWGVYADHAGGFVLLRYEDFMADKLRAIDDLARALNLAPTIDITGRLDVQFQPRGDRSVRWCDFYGAANLARIERVCRIGMTACGYGPRPSRRARAVSQS